jgi:hypothetical protein
MAGGWLFILNELLTVDELPQSDGDGLSGARRERFAVLRRPPHRRRCRRHRQLRRRRRSRGGRRRSGGGKRGGVGGTEGRGGGGGAVAVDVGGSEEQGELRLGGDQHGHDEGKGLGRHHTLAQRIERLLAGTLREKQMQKKGKVMEKEM